MPGSPSARRTRARTHLPPPARGPSGAQAPPSRSPQPADHRASRPPGFLEGFRKCLETRCALVGVVPPRVWKLGAAGPWSGYSFFPASSPPCLRVRPSSAARLPQPGPPLELAVSNGSGPGRRSGALCGQTRPPLGTGLGVWRGGQTRGRPGPQGVGVGPPGRRPGPRPQTLCQDSLPGARFLHPAPLCDVFCLKMGSRPHVIFYPAASTT